MQDLPFRLRRSMLSYPRLKETARAFATMVHYNALS
jgi:hypothetical protein